MYIKRQAENLLEKLSHDFPVVLISGPRQVGKSTLFHRIKGEKTNFVTMDDLDLRMMAKSDPKLFLDIYKPPLVIDEIQYAPELFPYLKMMVDEVRMKGENANGMYWLTGSQQFQMMKNVSESLAGRIGILELFSMNQQEIDQTTIFHSFHSDALEIMKNGVVYEKDALTIFRQIFQGGMPEVIINPPISSQYYNAYLQTYLQRDIRDLAQVGDLLKFYNFLGIVAARTSQQLEYTTIANEVGVSMPTIKHWISILVASGILYLLHPFQNNLSKRLIKSPKLYFMDTGLCAFLCKWTSPEVLLQGAMSGAFFETYVVSEIVKNFANQGKLTDLYYYRDKDKKEIDLLFIENGTITPIEIKKAISPAKADQHFSVLSKFPYEMKMGLVICMCKKAELYSSRAIKVPVAML